MIYYSPKNIYLCDLVYLGAEVSGLDEQKDRQTVTVSWVGHEPYRLVVKACPQGWHVIKGENIKLSELTDFMVDRFEPTVAPHRVKYYNRYDIQWLIDSVKSGSKFRYTTFWQANEGCENRMLSQWYQGNPIMINGRKYSTAEQYMMSEKALLFHDMHSYEKIMAACDPAECKQLGRGVKNFDSDRWESAFREIIFHGNLAKAQSDIEIVVALLSTGNSILVEASPLDDKYGVGISSKNLLNDDGTLKIMPWDWHKKDSHKQAENHLGFVLMGVRDLYRDLLRECYFPGMAKPEYMS